jgi:hypothetical protein
MSQVSTLKSWWRWESTDMAENLLWSRVPLWNREGDFHLFSTFLPLYKQR